MGFWKNLRDVLHSPDIVAELEQERTVRQQLSAALSDANNELEKMDTDVFLLERKLEHTTTQLDACQAAGPLLLCAVALHRGPKTDL